MSAGWRKRWRTHWRRIAGGFSIVCVVSSAVRAQSVSQASPDVLAAVKERTPHVPFSNPDSLRMRLGHTPAATYTTYTTPGECLAAFHYIQYVGTRTEFPDTLPTWQQQDTLLTAARDAGIRCARQFPINTVPPQEIQDAFTLWALVGDSSQTMAALERWLVAPPAVGEQGESPVEMRANRLVIAIDSLLPLRPRYADTTVAARMLQQAQQLLQRLDALGPTVRVPQLQAHTFVLTRALDVADAHGVWNPPQVMHDVETLLARYDAVTEDERGSVFNENPWTIKVLVLRLIQAKGFLDPHGVGAFVDSLRAASPIVAVALQGGGSPWAPEDYQAVGTSLVPVTGDYWFHAQGSSALPHPGKVLLLEPNGMLEERQTMMEVRRLDSLYGTRGLEIAMITKTKGYWERGGSHTGPVSAVEEATDDSAWYLGTLHLPITLVVATTSFTRRDDGKLIQSAPLPFELHYGPKWILCDRQGRVVMQGDPDYITFTLLRAYVDRAVGP